MTFIKQVTDHGRVVGEIKVSKMTRKNHEKSSFMFQDLFSYLGLKEAKAVDLEQDYVYDINYLFVEEGHRRRGLGSRLISEAMTELRIKDSNIANVIVSVRSSLTTKEFPVEPGIEGYNRVLERNKKFYEKNYFVDVNDDIGYYECSTVMIRNTPALHKLQAIIESDQIKRGNRKDERK